MQGISLRRVTSDSVYCIIRATVLPTQKTHGVYKTAIAIYNSTGGVWYARCECIAGRSSCNHTAALMFAIYDLNWHQDSRIPSCTSLPKKWGIPSQQKKEPIPARELEAVKPVYGKQCVHISNRVDVQPLPPATGLADMNRVMKLRADLQKNYRGTLLFHHVWPSKPDPLQESRLVRQQSTANSHISIDPTCHEH